MTLPLLLKLPIGTSMSFQYFKQYRPKVGQSREIKRVEIRVYKPFEPWRKPYRVAGICSRQRARQTPLRAIQCCVPIFSPHYYHSTSCKNVWHRKNAGRTTTLAATVWPRTPYWMQTSRARACASESSRLRAITNSAEPSIWNNQWILIKQAG